MGVCVCGGGGGYGGASRLQRQALASQYPDISVERKKGPRGPRGGRGGLQSSVAELCAGEGEARAPFQPPGVWGLRDVRREQGGVTIQQRSGRTTKPSGGGGAERGHRGEPPPPPFARANNRGCRENWKRAGRGKLSVKSAPILDRTSEGVGDRGEVGVGAAARGPLPCTSPHRTWSRPKCNTFSLSEELGCFLCWSSGCGGARGSPGRHRSDGSD